VRSRSQTNNQECRQVLRAFISELPRLTWLVTASMYALQFRNFWPFRVQAHRPSAPKMSVISRVFLCVDVCTRPHNAPPPIQAVISLWFLALVHVSGSHIYVDSSGRRIALMHNRLQVSCLFINLCLSGFIVDLFCLLQHINKRRALHNVDTTNTSQLEALNLLQRNGTSNYHWIL